jgi:hypothetical protein
MCSQQHQISEGTSVYNQRGFIHTQKLPAYKLYRNMKEFWLVIGQAHILNVAFDAFL